MRLMLGLDNGDGRTTFGGTEFRSMKEPMRHVGALLEAKAFHPTRKARNHLRLLASANNIPDTRVDEVMAMVGLNSVAHDKPKKFSLGMGQRLGIAAALLGDPHTLISTSRPTGWTRRASPGCATCSSSSQARGARSSSPATCCRRWRCSRTSSSSSDVGS
jgi:ABC-type Na+ transport system ATPase subunit NatA